MSRLFYNSAVWGPLSRAQLRGLEVDTLVVYRGVCGMPHRDPTRSRAADVEVLAEARRPCAVARLRIARLRYLPRMLRHAPPQLHALLDVLLAQQTGWPVLLEAGLRWARPYWGAETGDSPMTQLREDLHAARIAPEDWQRRVQLVADRFGFRFADECRRLRWRAELTALCEAGVPAPLPHSGCADLADLRRAPPLRPADEAPAATGDAPDDPPRFVCYDCGAVLTTRSSWTQHRTRTHGVLHRARLFAPGSACQACMRDFRTRPRLVWHLRHAKPRCLAALEAFFPPLEAEVADALDAADRVSEAKVRTAGGHARQASLPALSLAGPAVPPCAGELLPRVVPPAAPEPAPPPAPVPGPVQRLAQQAYFVLHLFSGQRRPGDLQHELEKLQAQAPYPAFVLSLDVAVDRQRGDLSRPEFVAQWLQLARQGRVLAVMGGPPCETWSVARYRPNTPRQGTALPRTLRSQQRPWGLLDLTERERTQVELGNALLRTQILFLYAAAAVGFAAVMEHPARPTWNPGAPSSWLLPELQHLSGLPGVDVVQLDQCTAGAPWRKPTTLLAVNLPSLRLQVAALPGGGRCSPALGHVHQSLVGKAEDGTWRTAPAKTYPQGLCALLARSFHEHVAGALPHFFGFSPADVDIEPELAHLSVPIDFYDPQSWVARGHDCAAMREA